MTATTKHAHFTPPRKDECERKRVLTMKYGKQQIELIRKRLRVEAWLLDALDSLYEEDCGGSGSAVDIDIDTVLDIETDSERKCFLREQLKECTASDERIQKFIAETLERLKTL